MVRAGADRADASARLGLRSEASARFERGVDPYGIDTAIARFVELLGETCPDLVVARRRRRRPGRVAAAGRALVRRCASARSTASSARRSPPTTCRRCSTRSGSPSTGDGRRARRRASRRGGPTAPRRSTSSRRSPASTATTASASGCRRRRVHGRLSRAPAAPPPAAPGAARARASPRRCRTRSWRPTTLAPGRARRRRPADHQPARRRGERAAARRCGPGLLRAVAFNESHRRTGVALFEIGHVYPPGPGELPDEYEALGVVLAGAGGAGGGRGVAGDRRGDGHRRPHRPGPRAGRAAPDPVGDAGRRARRRSARSARSRRTCSRRSAIAERVAVLELDLRHVLDREPKPAAVEADEPAPVERPRPGLRAARRRAGRAAGQGDPPGRRRAARRPRAVRRLPRRRRRRRAAQPGLPPAPAGARPQPHRRRRRRGPRSGSRPRRPSSAPSCAADPSPSTSASARRAPPRRRRAGMGVGRRADGACRRCCSGRWPSPCARAATTRRESISGPAEELPAVVAAAEDLLGTVPAAGVDRRPSCGAAYGEVTRRVHRAAATSWTSPPRFDRLPDAEARLLGRTLGAIQAQLSPTEVGGARDGDDRAADIVFALAAGPGDGRRPWTPTGRDRDRALAILPFSRPGPDRLRRHGRPRSPAGDLDRAGRSGSTPRCPTPALPSSSARSPTRSANASRPTTRSRHRVPRRLRTAAANTG